MARTRDGEMQNGSDPLQGRIADGVYNDILAGILLGEYPTHSTLPPESRLAEEYGVSRTVVRSALEVLKREGVVKSRQGSGTVVAESDRHKMALLNRNAQLAQLQQCFECRMAVEPEIAAKVASDLSEEARVYLSAQAAALEDPIDTDQTESYRAAQDAAFHIRLAELSGNAFFSSIMSTLRPHVLFAMNVIKAMQPGDRTIHIAELHLEHRAIVKAILQLDSEGARQLMRIHLENGHRRIFQVR